MFEYTAVGLPVVVSDLPELRRIALDAGCGAVYDPFVARDFARAVSEVLLPLRYARHRAAVARFRRDNSWQREREILVAEYQRLGLTPSAGATISLPPARRSAHQPVAAAAAGRA